MKLREFLNYKQESGAGKRRYFSSTSLELVVWYNEDGSREGFQICYRLMGREKALTYKEKRGYYHNNVSTCIPFSEYRRNPFGHASSAFKMPFLVPNGAIPRDHVVNLFEESCDGLEEELTAWIRGKLELAPEM